MATATITAKGQITIPKEIRDALELQLGDQVIFVREGERVFLLPVRRTGLTQLRGVLRDKPVGDNKEAERAAAQVIAIENATRDLPR
jgi:antitoxin PrlF